MLGTEKALISKICETMSVTDGLLEFIDNPLDKEAKNIYVTYDSNEDYIKIYNDGKPFINLDNYLQEFIGCFEHNIGDIGSRNQGSKQAAVCLLDNHVGVMRIFSPVPNKNYALYGEITFNISNKEESIKSGCEVLSYDDSVFKTLNNKYGIKKNGVTFILEHLKEETKNNFYNLEKECSKRYGKCMMTKKSNLYIQDKKISYEDPLFLKVLGEDINKEGFHIKDDIVFFVKTHRFSFNGESRQFKTILTYITREKYYDVTQIPGYEKMLKHTGIYTFLGDRIMDCGGNISEMFGDDLNSYYSNSGGTDRVRMGIFCDGNNDLFDVSSNKTQGIKKLYLNKNLRENSVSLEKRIISLKVGNKSQKKKINGYHYVYDELLNDFSMFEKLNRYEASIDTKINKITLNILDKLYNGITPKKKTETQNYNKITDNDYINNEEQLNCFLIKIMQDIKEKTIQDMFKSFYLATRDKVNEKKTKEIMEKMLENFKTIEYEEGNKVYRGEEAA